VLVNVPVAPVETVKFPTTDVSPVIVVVPVKFIAVAIRFNKSSFKLN
jgi:hypothetical protein